jgi:hypothetical protein
MRPSLIRRALRTVLFTCHATALFVGIWVARLAILYRPYILCGNLMCSFGDEYYRTAPVAMSGDSVDFDVPLYVFQLALISWVTSMVLLLLKSGGTKRRTWTVLKTSIFGIAAMHIVLIFVVAPITWLLDGSPLVFKALLILACVGAVRLRLVSNEENIVRMSSDCIRACFSHIMETVIDGGARKRQEYLRSKIVAYTIVVICGVVSYVGFALAALVILRLRVSWASMLPDWKVIENMASCVGGGLLAGFAGFHGCGLAEKRADTLAYVPSVKEQIAALPAHETLLRSSGQPAAAPDELLRAAHKGTLVPSDELLRPGMMIGEETQYLRSRSVISRGERRVFPWQ